MMEVRVNTRSTFFKNYLENHKLQKHTNKLIYKNMLIIMTKKLSLNKLDLFWVQI